MILAIDPGKVPHEEKMLPSGTDPESYITDYTLVYEDKWSAIRQGGFKAGDQVRLLTESKLPPVEMDPEAATSHPYPLCMRKINMIYKLYIDRWIDR